MQAVKCLRDQADQFASINVSGDYVCDRYDSINFVSNQMDHVLAKHNWFSRFPAQILSVEIEAMLERNEIDDEVCPGGTSSLG